MLLALLFLPILTVSANPFHKYPYVFLLDVGNEELEKVNTEQIRLSSPGGSVALRYPAIGSGDDIAHVRISGIDFGTDLKASIVDGGPGYKYVVIVLIGNSGVAFDAVITIETVPSNASGDRLQTIDDSSSGNANEDIPIGQENDPNTSAEDLKDYEESDGQVGVNEKSGEITQESSNVYSYTQNEALNGYGSSHNYEESDKNRDDDESAGNDSIYNSFKDQSENVEVEDYDPNEDDSRLSQSSAGINTDDGNIQFDSKPEIEQDLYNRYIALKGHIYDGSEVYSQGRREQSDPDYSINENYDDRLVDAYDDYEEINLEKYRDVNNNYIDTDEASAVDQ